MGAAARLVAAALCLSALVGLALELANLIGGGTSLGAALWRLALFFTILTNVLVAIVFGLAAWQGPRFEHFKTLAGVVAAIALVGVVVALLLQGARPLGGATLVSDFLLHRFTPVLAPAYWLAFVPKGRLAWRDPLLWALYPLVYLGYALARGHSDGRYPYPFIDVAANGWANVIATSLAIAAGFVVAGAAMVALDRALARRRA
jgi:hypothetical protein